MLGTTLHHDITIFWDHVLNYIPNNSDKNELLLDENFSTKISTLTLAPNLNQAVLDVIYNSPDHIDAVIIEAFGQGNIPSNTMLKKILREKKGNGVLTFITSQCHKGSVGESYNSSAGFLGAILCGDMTLPAVFCKVSLLLGKTRDTEKISQAIMKSARGEVTEKEYTLKGKEGGAISFFENKLNPYISKEDEMSAILDHLLPTLALSAAKYNNTRVLEDLISYDKNILMSQSYCKFNLLHASAFHFLPKTLEYLKAHMSHDVFVRLINSEDADGWTPMDYAVKQENEEAVIALRHAGATYGDDLPPVELIQDILE